MSQLPSLPALPKSSRRSQVVRPCACGGCGCTTKSNWFPGHDGYCSGWAVRLERGLLAKSDVPQSVIAGVEREWKRRNPTGDWSKVK